MRILIILFLLAAVSVNAQVSTQFNGSLNVFSSSGSNPYTVTGFFSNATGQYASEDVEVGDVIFLSAGDACGRLVIDSILTSAGSIITARVVDNEGVYAAPPTGIGPVLRETVNYEYPLFVSGIAQSLVSCIQTHFAIQVDLRTDSLISSIFFPEADTLTTIIYKPAHGHDLNDYTGGVLALKQGFDPADATTTANIQVTYAVSVPNPDSLEIKTRGLVQRPAHGLAPGRVYYLTDVAGTYDTIPGTVVAPVFLVIDENQLELLEVGAASDYVIPRRVIISPLISAFGGDVAAPSDSVIQAIAVFMKGLGLLRPGSVLVTQTSGSSRNPAHKGNTNDPTSPAQVWFWNGAVTTRIYNAVASVSVTDTLYGAFGNLPLTPVTNLPPDDDDIASWYWTNYHNNGLRLQNGSKIIYVGTGTIQNPQRIWTLADFLGVSTDPDSLRIVLRTKDDGSPTPILNKLWVSPNGNDATAEKGNLFKPWQDIRTAFAAGGNTNAILDAGSYAITATSGAFPNAFDRRIFQGPNNSIFSREPVTITTSINSNLGAFNDNTTSENTSTPMRNTIDCPNCDFIFTNSADFGYGMTFTDVNSHTLINIRDFRNTSGRGSGIRIGGNADIKIREMEQKYVGLSISYGTDSIGQKGNHNRVVNAHIKRFLTTNFASNAGVGAIRYSMLTPTDTNATIRVRVDQVDYLSGNDINVLSIEGYGGLNNYVEFNFGKVRVNSTGGTARGFMRFSTSNTPSNRLSNSTFVINIDDIQDNHFWESVGEDARWDNSKIFVNIKRGRFSGLFWDLTDLVLSNNTEWHIHCDDCEVGGDVLQWQGGLQHVQIDSTSKIVLSGYWKMNGAHQLIQYNNFSGNSNGSGRVVLKNVVATNNNGAAIITSPNGVPFLVDCYNVVTNCTVIDTDVVERVTPIIRDTNVK